jgi:RNA polymerase sigma factor (sigma-70 family)
MTDDPLDSLLVQLCQGDAAAAEQVFLAYEPYLRKVVRRQLPAKLRSKFDSVDVVQSVWADLLDGFRTSGWRFADKEHLLAFLVKITRNRFIDHIRHHRRALELEQALPADESTGQLTSAEPRPSQLVQADELWQKMLALCPPTHRDVLQFKREGLSLAEIAQRTGLHMDSIRRIMRRVALRLSFDPELQSRLGCGEE